MSCGNNLKQLALATHNFHDVNGRFPPGYLGPVPHDTWDNHMTDNQYVGVLAYLLPFMEQKQVQELITTNMEVKTVDTAWWGNGSTVAAANSRISLFLCPSANTIEGPQGTTATINIWNDSGTLTCELIAFPASTPNADRLGRTNYLGVAGYFGNVPNSSQATLYDGVFGNRTVYSFSNITDGTSNTLLFGEHMGGRQNNQQQYVHAWIGTGLMVTSNGLSLQEWPAFSSMHPSVVQFAIADGAVRTVPRTINHDTYIYLSGRGDARTATLD